MERVFFFFLFLFFLKKKIITNIDVHQHAQSLHDSDIAEQRRQQLRVLLQHLDLHLKLGILGKRSGARVRGNL